ncbi:hypothetical protein [Flavobacterium sp. W21_SRS_FM6]|uniref:hypothetical protein n=1 Tax=Flavobacterium sp. W21_SRS_FM6 TaxID=3240268 RepID=UPI003F93BD7F
MHSSNHALAACQKIHRLGKTPTVALVRQYSSQSLTIPEIVKAIQMWKNNPKIVIEEPKETKLSAPDNLEERVKMLEKHVVELSNKLDSLMRAAT